METALYVLVSVYFVVNFIIFLFTYRLVNASSKELKLNKTERIHKEFAEKNRYKLYAYVLLLGTIVLVKKYLRE